MLTSFMTVVALTSLPHVMAPSQCRFREANQLMHRWEGSCGHLFEQEPKMTLKPAKGIVSGRWRSDATPTAVWAGQMTDDGSGSDIELEIYDGGGGVFRTEYGWYSVSAFTASPTLIAFEIDTARTVSPSDLDHQIVRRADALLSSTAVWNRADDRRCPGSATMLSIYCAMERATIEITCGPHHRRPAMEVVRQVVEERSVGRNYEHRLMNYNNDSRTTLADVRSLFADALTRMHASPDEPAPKVAECPAVLSPAITAVDIKIVERAAEILASPGRWNRHDLQACPATAKTYGIFCALKKASEETIGEFDEVSPVMREARQVIDFVAAKQYAARLVDYNNDPRTSFADVQAFFRILRNRLTRRMGAGD